MSIRVMQWVIDHGPDDRTLFDVLQALAWFADDDGRCWPSVARLAATARMSDRAVQKAVQRLEEDGWIVASRRTGRTHSTRYRIMKRANTVHPSDAERANGVHPYNPEPGSPFLPERVNATTIKGEPGSPEPSKNLIDAYDSVRASARERILAAMGVGPDGIIGPSRFTGTTADMAEADRWTTDLGLTEDQVIAVIREVMARKRDGPPARFRYFTPAMQDLAGQIAAKPLTPSEARQGVTRQDNVYDLNAAFARIFGDKS